MKVAAVALALTLVAAPTKKETPTKKPEAEVGICSHYVASASGESRQRVLEEKVSFDECSFRLHVVCRELAKKLKFIACAYTWDNLPEEEPPGSYDDV